MKCRAYVCYLPAKCERVTRLLLFAGRKLLEHTIQNPITARLININHDTERIHGRQVSH